MDQEEAVNQEVKRILDQLDLYNASDINKVCGIYQYLCENVQYGDPYGQTQNTVYAALIEKTTLCGGYALAFYRLALELDVDTRFIAGYVWTGRHAWNIVQLDGLYYNLDATVDAGNNEYRYFLKSQGNFESHSRDAQYETEEFHQQYPMGSEDYDY